jgi:hypothetical protein
LSFQALQFHSREPKYQYEQNRCLPNYYIVPKRERLLERESIRKTDFCVKEKISTTSERSKPHPSLFGRGRAKRCRINGFFKAPKNNAENQNPRFLGRGGTLD